MVIEYEEERMIECPICNHDDVLYVESKSCDLCGKDVCRDCYDFSIDLCKECSNKIEEVRRSKLWGGVFGE